MRGSERGKEGGRERVTIATEEEGEKKTWRNFKKCKRQDKQRKKEFTGRQ